MREGDFFLSLISTLDSPIMRRAFFIFFFALFFVSCSSTRLVEKSTSPVYVTNTKKIFVLPPSCIENPVDSMQLLQGKFGEQSFTLLAYIQADESCINLNLFNDFGTDMGVLSYDGVSASFDSAVFPPELKAEYVINDLQCAYYKAEDLQKNFSSVGLKFEVQENARKIFSGNKLIEEINIGEGEVKIVNHLRGYEYILISADE